MQCSIKSSLKWRHTLQPVQQQQPLQEAISKQLEDLQWEDSDDIELVAGESYILHRVGGCVRAQAST